MSYCYIEDEGL